MKLCFRFDSTVCSVVFALANIAMFCYFGSKYFEANQDVMGLLTMDNFTSRIEDPVEHNKLPMTLDHSEHLLLKFLSLIKPVKSIKIYVPLPIKNKTDYAEKYPGIRFDYPSTILDPAATWFWVHNEYYASRYILHRARHDSQLFTDNITEADLCFPSCDNIPQYEPSSVGLTFKVTKDSEPKFSGCKEIVIKIESAVSACSFPVPYWHSIYSPDSPSIPPWDLPTARGNMLCFIGGSWRGNDRARTIAEMQAISHAGRGRGRRLFSAPFVFPSHADEGGVWGTPAFFARAWELYARSDFSWQPAGDTSTRRGFYDSWMLGCIPVVPRSSADAYRALFRGRLFGAAGPALEEVAVVLDDAAMGNGAAVLARLAAIPTAEVRRRREWLGGLAPLMQWGWGEGEGRADALQMAIAAVMAT